MLTEAGRDRRRGVRDGAVGAAGRPAAARCASAPTREPFELVFEVEDAFCPWNAGRWTGWRCDGETATCARPRRRRPTRSSPPSELGAAYLGGTTLATLARAGRVRELRPRRARAASRAFRGDVEPWCPEIF